MNQPILSQIPSSEGQRWPSAVLATTTPITGIWIHMLFPSLWEVGASGNASSNAGPFSENSITGVVGPENAKGNEFISFANPVESFLLEAQIVDFSVLELVNEQANKVGGGGGGKHVPDGGNTLTFLAAGLLGLVGVKMARKQGAA